jgi:hypothetical protein
MYRGTERRRRREVIGMEREEERNQRERNVRISEVGREEGQQVVSEVCRSSM